MRVPIIVEELADEARRGEPVSVGIPLEKGAVHRAGELRLLDEEGEIEPLQVTPLNRWADGSFKWVLIETLASALAGGHRDLRLETVSSEEPRQPAQPPTLALAESREEVSVDTGELRVTFSRLGTDLIRSIERGGSPVLDGRGLRLTLVDQDLIRHELVVTALDVTAAGPVRAAVAFRGKLGPVLEAFGEVSVFAGRGLIRLDLTVRNPRAACHKGGLWDLGDPGSVLVEDISLEARLAGARDQVGIRWTDQAGGELRETAGSWLEIYQDSSGGERWDCTNHLNREERIPLSFRGYRVRGEEPGRYGLRASPCLWLTSPETNLGGSETNLGGFKINLGAAIQEFWQSFPKSLEASAGRLVVGLWPGQHADLHEIQGGEQKTHRIWLSVEEPDNLGWIQEPLLARSTPAHYVHTGALSHLIEWDEDGDERMLALMAAAIDDERGLIARRERIDEYGWRNFGDVYADHEDVGNEAPEPRISHYNNQYDGCYGALAQFARSGDPRWFRLGAEMARHLADIDVYHTQLDRPVFNGGFFWHTDHYTDAGTCTHRCYTKLAPQAQAGPYGGGQSDEHLYATGMATYYLMTGWRPARESAISLANWVIDCDDGDLTPLGKLLPGPTGLASRTIDDDYHGPGRGAGNSIATLLDALELTGDERYLHKAEELIRRCTHPDDDRDAWELATDPEVRWSYTAYLISLIHYLEVKAERDELDQRYAYAQAVLTSYARWMVENETLSSAKKDALDIWSETWPVQDLRKGLILMSAALHADDPDERKLLHDLGREWYEGAVDDIHEWDEERRTLARPLFLVSRYGYPGSALRQHPGAPAYPIVPLTDRGQPSGFLSWKGRIKLAIRRLRP